jgi:hypothetical protein
MRIRVLFAAALAGLICFCCRPASADDPKPNKFTSDVIPSAFRAFLVTDGRFPPVKGPDGKDQPDPRIRAGKIHCLVCENGLAPVIAVFVRLHGPASTTLSPDKGVADLVMKTNRMISKDEFRANKLASFVMFLRLESGTKEVTVKNIKDKVEVETKVKEDLEFPDEDDLKRAEYVEDIKKFATALNSPNVPFGLAAEKSKALTEWKIEDKNDVTVVFYNRMRIVKTWTFEKPDGLTDEKVNEVLKTVEDLLIEKRK